jgi:hypothetical protein
VDLPLTSVSGHKYYLAILDDYSHFLWTFPLPLKSDTLSTLTTFFAYVRTQFGITIQGIRCDNGREFDNVRVRTFFFPRTAFTFVCHAPTPPRRMAKPNASYDP